MDCKVAEAQCGMQGKKKRRGDALSDTRGGGAVKSSSVGQWVSGPGSTTDSAELSLQRHMHAPRCLSNHVQTVFRFNILNL